MDCGWFPRRRIKMPRCPSQKVDVEELDSWRIIYNITTPLRRLFRGEPYQNVRYIYLGFPP
jgi:hypothetical protein